MGAVSRSFRVPVGLSIASVALLGLGMMPEITRRWQANAQRIELEVQADTAKAQAKAKADVDIARTKGIARSTIAERQSGVNRLRTLSIIDYDGNSDKPPVMAMTLFRDPEEQVLIFDKRNICVGLVHRGQFYWSKVKGNEQVCKN